MKLNMHLNFFVFSNLVGLSFVMAAMAPGKASAITSATTSYDAHCGTTECRAHQSKLVDLGYTPTIAERISLYRPDLSALITTPAATINLKDYAEAMPSGSGITSRWLESQVQDRGPITVYRGMTFEPGQKFDPTYFFKAEFPVYDSRIFTSQSLRTALGYANRPGKEGVLLKLEVPRFLLYEIIEGPYGLVYFRDLVANDLLFVSAVALVSYRPPAEIDDQIQSLVYSDLKDVSSKILPVPLVREERFDLNGSFSPSPVWVDTFCQITNHPFFSKLMTKITPSSDAVLLKSAVQITQNGDAPTAQIIAADLEKLDQAKLILSQIPLTRPDSAQSGEEMEQMLLSFAAESVHQCLTAQRLWLNQNYSR